MPEIDYLSELFDKKKLPEINLAEEAVRRAAVKPMAAPKSEPAIGLDPMAMRKQAVYLSSLADKQSAAVDKIKAMDAPAPMPSTRPPLPEGAYVGPGGTVIQRQPENVIDGSGPVIDKEKLIQFQPSDPQSLDANRASYNILHENIKDDIKKEGAHVAQQEAETKPYLDQMMELVNSYKQPVPAFKSQYAEMAEKIAKDGMNEKSYEPPQEDMLTKAIYAFGPGMGGAMLGENGMAAAPAAQKQAYDLRAQDQKAQLDAFKARQNEGSKRQLALKLLMDTEQESFNKQQDQQGKQTDKAGEMLSSLSKEASVRLDDAIKNKHELTKIKYEKGFISIKEYQDQIGALESLTNQKAIADANRDAQGNRFEAEEAGRNQRAKEQNETTLKTAGMKGDSAAKVAGIRVASKAGAGGAKSYEQKLAGLKGGDKARYDSAIMGLKAVDDMEAALAAGDNTFSWIGDNKYTIAKGEASEAFGRMQSGGAINDEEGKKFDKRSPGFTDKEDVRKFKISRQREEFLSRLNTLGFPPEEVQAQRTKMKQGASAPLDTKSMTRAQKIEAAKKMGYK